MNITVSPWSDPAVETHGIPAFSTEAEDYWLPVLGPTALLVGRRLVRWVEANDGPVVVNLDLLAQMHGVSTNALHGALNRLQRWRIVDQASDGGVVIRTVWPELRKGDVARLPESLRLSWAARRRVDA